jgi:hypothetical protein
MHLSLNLGVSKSRRGPQRNYSLAEAEPGNSLIEGRFLEYFAHSPTTADAMAALGQFPGGSNAPVRRLPTGANPSLTTNTTTP